MAYIDAVSPIVQGMLHGAQVGHLIRQSALQEEAMHRAEFQQQRENEIQDITLQQKLLNSSRPVDEAGTVADTATFDPLPGTIGGAPIEGKIQRKAESGRTVKYGGRSYELMTPEEQMDRELKATLKEKTATGGLHNTQALDLLRQQTEFSNENTIAQERRKRTEFGLDVPNPYNPTGPKIRALPTEASELARLETAVHPKESEQDKERRELKDNAPALLSSVDQLTSDPRARLILKAAVNAHIQAGNRNGALETIRQFATAEAKGTDSDLQTAKIAAAAAAGAARATAAAGNPEETSSVAHAIANYQMPAPTLSRSGQNKALMAKVLEINPAYDASTFPTRSKLQAAYASGKESQAITSNNTAIGHLGTLYDAAEKLDNSAFRKYNSFSNWLLEQKGSDQVKPFMVARDAVSEELAKALKGGVATGEEVAKWERNINSADSPAQLKAAIRTITELMGSRLHALQDTYEAGMGKPPATPFIRERSQKILEKMAAAPAAGSGYKQTATGPDGHKLGTNDNGKTWFDLQTGKKVE